ncbi:MAG: hypothetical protein KDE25_08500, partial [Novosphingobium sp.]|nr:hypothetical protein [Novosphingobium sp.]
DLCALNALANGDMVRLTSRAGQLEGAVRIDDTLKEGTVWMNHGWLGRNVNQLIDTQGIDPLTTQPFFSAIPVKVEKLLQ